MYLSEMIEQAEHIAEESYSFPEWNTLVQQVLSDLAPAAKNLKQVSFDKPEGAVLVDIAVAEKIDDLYEVVSVSFKPDGKRSRPLRHLSLADTVSTGWMKDAGRIIVQELPEDKGEIVIDYYGTIKIVDEGQEKTFDLPVEHHDVILKGLLSKVAQKEEEFDRRQDFYSEYLAAKNEMMGKRIKEVETWNKNISAPLRYGMGGQDK